MVKDREKSSVLELSDEKMKTIFTGEEKWLVESFEKNPELTRALIKDYKKFDSIIYGNFGRYFSELTDEERGYAVYAFTIFVHHYAIDPGANPPDMQRFQEVALDNEGKIRNQKFIDLAYGLSLKDKTGEKIGFLQGIMKVTEEELYRLIVENDDFKTQLIKFFDNDLETLEGNYNLLEEALQAAKDKKYSKAEFVIELVSKPQASEKLKAIQGLLGKDSKVTYKKIAEDRDLKNTLLRIFDKELEAIEEISKNKELIEFIGKDIDNSKRRPYAIHAFEMLVRHADRPLDMQVFKEVALNGKGEIRNPKIIDLARELAAKDQASEKLAAIQGLLGKDPKKIYKIIADNPALKLNLEEMLEKDLALIQKTMQIVIRNKLDITKGEDWAQITELLALQEKVRKLKENSSVVIVINKLLEKKSVLNINPQVVALATKLAETPEISEYILKAYATDKKDTDLRDKVADSVKDNLAKNPKKLQKLSAFYDVTKPIMQKIYDTRPQEPGLVGFMQQYMKQKAFILHKLIDAKQVDSFNKELNAKLAKITDPAKKQTAINEVQEFWKGMNKFWEKITLDDNALGKLNAMESFWAKSLKVKGNDVYKELAKSEELQARFMKMFEKDTTIIQKTMDTIAKNKLDVSKEADWDKITKVIELREITSNSKFVENVIDKMLLDKSGKCRMLALDSALLAAKDPEKFKNDVVKLEWELYSGKIFPLWKKTEKEFKEDFKGEKFEAAFAKSNYFKNKRFMGAEAEGIHQSKSGLADEVPAKLKDKIAEPQPVQIPGVMIIVGPDKTPGPGRGV